MWRLSVWRCREGGGGWGRLEGGMEVQEEEEEGWMSERGRSLCLSVQGKGIEWRGNIN